MDSRRLPRANTWKIPPSRSCPRLARHVEEEADAARPPDRAPPHAGGPRGGVSGGGQARESPPLMGSDPLSPPPSRGLTPRSGKGSDPRSGGLSPALGSLAPRRASGGTALSAQVGWALCSACPARLSSSSSSSVVSVLAASVAAAASAARTRSIAVDRTWATISARPRSGFRRSCAWPGWQHGRRAGVRRAHSARGSPARRPAPRPPAPAPHRPRELGRHGAAGANEAQRVPSQHARVAHRVVHLPRRARVALEP